MQIRHLNCPLILEKKKKKKRFATARFYKKLFVNSVVSILHVYFARAEKISHNKLRSYSLAQKRHRIISLTLH